jgi:hypothetical protein
MTNNKNQRNPKSQMSNSKSEGKHPIINTRTMEIPNPKFENEVRQRG